MITSDRSAEVCFRDLGFESHTWGAFRHDIASFIMRYMMPKFVMFKIMTNWLAKHRAD